MRIGDKEGEVVHYRCREREGKDSGHPPKKKKTGQPSPPMPKKKLKIFPPNRKKKKGEGVSSKARPHTEKRKKKQSSIFR